MQNSKSFNLIGDEITFESSFVTRVLDHSHIAVNVDLVDKLDEEVQTPFGELKKSKLEGDVKFLKAKTNKNDKEFLNQIAYLQSLTKMVSNQGFHVIERHFHSRFYFSSPKRK